MVLVRGLETRPARLLVDFVFIDHGKESLFTRSRISVH